jgi:hypothetical protein
MPQGMAAAVALPLLPLPLLLALASSALLLTLALLLSAPVSPVVPGVAAVAALKQKAERRLACLPLSDRASELLLLQMKKAGLLSPKGCL